MSSLCGFVCLLVALQSKRFAEMYISIWQYSFIRQQVSACDKLVLDGTVGSENCLRTATRSSRNLVLDSRCCSLDTVSDSHFAELLV